MSDRLLEEAVDNFYNTVEEAVEPRARIKRKR